MFGRKRPGQEEARAFYEREYPPLYRYVLYLTREPDAAEDICQEAFIRWFSRPDRSDVAAPGAWLRRTAGRLACDFKRKQGLSERWEVSSVTSLPEPAITMEAELVRLEVGDVLDRLPLRDQMLLCMRLAGMSYAEIANTTGLPMGSVGTMIARAMKRFREEYEGKEVGQSHGMSR